MRNLPKMCHSSRVTRSCKTTGSAIRFWRDARPAQIDLIEAAMLPRTETIATTAQNWLTQFETALASPDDVLLKTLFHADSYWRDLLAFTWRIRTVNGADAILRELKAHIGSVRPAAFTIDPGGAAPRHVMRAGADAIEAIFTFETAEGRGNGVLRLTPDLGDGNTLKAGTLLPA